MTEQPPSASEHARGLLLEWMRSRPGGTYQSSIQATEFKRLIDIIAAALSAETERWQHRDRQRLEQIDRLQETVGSFQSAQAERPAPETVHLTLREQNVMKRALLRSTRIMPADHPLQTGPSAPAPTGGSPVSDDLVLQPYAGTIWRHHKRGTTYEMVGTAEVQATDPLAEGQRAVVYRSTHDGKLWVRPDEEFFDGRFDPITPFDLASTGEQPDCGEEPRCEGGVLLGTMGATCPKCGATDNDLCGYLFSAGPRTDAGGLSSTSPSPAVVGDYTERAQRVWHNIADGNMGQAVAIIRNALSAVASERDAAAMRAFGQRVWSDTEEVAYQAGVSDTLETLK